MILHREKSKTRGIRDFGQIRPRPATRGKIENRGLANPPYFTRSQILRWMVELVLTLIRSRPATRGKIENPGFANPRLTLRVWEYYAPHTAGP